MKVISSIHYFKVNLCRSTRSPVISFNYFKAAKLNLQRFKFEYFCLFLNMLYTWFDSLDYPQTLIEVWPYSFLLKASLFGLSSRQKFSQKADVQRLNHFISRLAPYKWVTLRSGSNHSFPAAVSKKDKWNCFLLPLRPPSEQSPTTNSGPSPSRSVPTTTTPAPSNQSGTARQSQAAVGGAKPSTLPANLDEFKVS